MLVIDSKNAITSGKNISGQHLLSLAVIALCLLLVVQGSLAKQREFGLDVIIGEPTASVRSYGHLPSRQRINSFFHPFGQLGFEVIMAHYFEFKKRFSVLE